MKMTVVACGSASAAMFSPGGRLPVVSAAVMNCTRWAWPRRVSGMPAAAAAAEAEVTPGMISHAIPAARRAVSSSSSRPKMPQSPDFSRTTCAPVRA